MQEVNFLPGRVRLRIGEICYNKGLSRYLNVYLDNLYGVKYSTVNHYTATVLIFYDTHKISYKLIKQNLQSALSSFRKNENLDLGKYDAYYKTLEKRDKALRNVMLYSLIYMILKIKHSLFGKFSLSTNVNVLKAASAISIIVGYPLIKGFYKKCARSIPADPDILLHLSAFALTVLRESTHSVLVLFLESLNDYIKLSAQLDGQRLLSQSMSQSAGMAWLCTGENRQVLVPAGSLKVNDNIFVKQGEVVPAEGEIIEGKAIVNSLFHTGQPVVTHIESGNKVFEGISILSGGLKVKVDKLPKPEDKPDINEILKIQSKVTRYQDLITPVSIGMSLLNYLTSGSVLKAISVLLELSPSASQTALSSGLKSNFSLLNKYKIFLRNPGVFEKIASIDHIIFDKTGTLTQGVMHIEKIETFTDEYSVKDILRISAACEVDNYHPIAVTIQDEVVDDYDVSKVRSSAFIPSKGVIAFYDNRRVIIGNKEIMEENNVDINAGINKYTECEKELYTPVFISIGNKLAGLIVMQDLMRDNAYRLIQKLKYKGFTNISIVTGDEYDKAYSLAAKLGINNIYSNCSGEDKQKIIRNIQKNGTVMMVGDGINDILAMKSADVSISFTDSACDKAKLHSDCIILEDNISRLADLVALSQKSYNSIHESINASQVYNAVFGALALFNRFDAFTAKTLNTVNSLLVLLLNKRIEYLSPSSFISGLVGRKSAK